MDERLRRLERDPKYGVNFFYERRRSGKPLEAIDYEALARYEVDGGEIPYEIDLAIRFPYDIARALWDRNQCCQTYYRVRKVQEDEVKRALWDFARSIKMRVNEEDISVHRFRGGNSGGNYRRAVAMRKRIIVSLTDQELGDLWIKDIKSKVYRQRIVNDGKMAVIDAMIKSQKGSEPELIRLKWHVLITEYLGLKTEQIFRLSYGRNCCYDSQYYLGGTVSMEALNVSHRGRHIDFFVEYGRLPIRFGGLHFNSYPTESFSGAYPISYRPSKEELEARMIPDIIFLNDVVNANHIFDIARACYDEFIPRLKKDFYTRTHKDVLTNEEVMNSVFYKDDYAHLWQVSRYIKDILAGKMPEDEYIQQYRFITKGNSIYVVCPVTAKEVNVLDWDSHAESLIEL